MSELKKKINYTVACVNEFADRYQLSSKEAFGYLYDHKGIEFLKENYDIEHTLSFDDAVDDYFVLKAPALLRKSTGDMQISTTDTPFSTTRHTNSVTELNVSKPC